MAERYEDRRYIPDDEPVSAARPPADSTAKEGDPLAELARLIGQTDPFANFGRSNPTHPLRNSPRSQPDAPRSDRGGDDYFDNEIFDEAPNPPASPPPWVQHRNEALAVGEQPDDSDFNHRPHPLHRFSPTSDSGDAETPVQYPDGAYQDAHYGDGAPFPDASYQNDPYAYADGYADQPDAARGSRRSLLTVAAVVGLAVIGTGGAYAYRTYVSAPRSGDVPVIRADNAPIKVVPPTASDANKVIQDRLGAPGGENLVPREEQPVDVRDPTKAGARPPASSFAARAPSSGAVPVPPGPVNALPGGDEPRKVRTVTIKGDQSDAAVSSTPKPTSRVQPPAVAAPARPAAAPGPVASVAPAPAGPLSLARPQANGPAPASLTSGGYVVQVSSQRSESDAQASYRALQTKFPTVLGSRSSTIKRADLGEKGTYYRAVLGPFKSPEEAAQLCGNLKSAGGQCVVQRN